MFLCFLWNAASIRRQTGYAEVSPGRRAKRYRTHSHNIGSDSKGAGASRLYPAGYRTRTLNMVILTTPVISDCRDGSCARPLNYCPSPIHVHGKSMTRSARSPARELAIMAKRFERNNSLPPVLFCRYIAHLPQLYQTSPDFPPFRSQSPDLFSSTRESCVSVSCTFFCPRLHWCA